MRHYTFCVVLLMLAMSACSRRCHVSGCMIVDDHTHFFGAINSYDGDRVEREKVQQSDLKVYNGTVWWRRAFKKTYRSESGKKYKKFDKEKASGLDKNQLNKPSIRKQKGGFD